MIFFSPVFGQGDAPEHLIVELFEDDNRAEKLLASSVLLKSYVLAQMAEPYLPFMEKYAMRLGVNHRFLIMPLPEVLFAMRMGCVHMS